MMKNKNNSVNLTRFSQTKMHTKIACCVLATFLCSSNRLQASFSKDSEGESYKFPGIVMKTGFAVTPSSQKELEDNHRRSVMRAVAEAAQERAQTAKLIFAFKHNFLIPTWLREELPDEVSSQLMSFNMYDIQLSVAKPLDEMRNTITALLYFNGLETDPLVASMSPASRLVRLVNEAGFEQEASSFEKAKTFALLAMRLDAYNTLGLTHGDSNTMMGALYNKAAQEVSSVASELPAVVLADLYTSAGQLKRWAAHRTDDSRKKTTYIVDSLELFSKARLYTDAAENGEALLDKVKQEQHFALDLFEEILLGKGLIESGVKKFIASRRLEI
ncbi:MAG: hypothetical protein GW748_04720 [Alphaproteobacteria bacterium]|nr:hypothetical protein [Alphaproteobacteria bacterium]NCQ67028.1 hypothetical protein [Alphaproteobacteria bacterium]NCT07625.1 hypothetical protein [Alphaproteobacteria bacterium]